LKAQPAIPAIEIVINLLLSKNKFSYRKF